MIKIQNKDYIIEGGVVVEHTKIIEPLQLNQNYIDTLLQNSQPSTQPSTQPSSQIITGEVIKQTIKNKIINKINKKSNKNNENNIENNIYKIPKDIGKKKLNYILKRIHS
jgi:hypothetical protein